MELAGFNESERKEMLELALTTMFSLTEIRGAYTVLCDFKMVKGCIRFSAETNHSLEVVVDVYKELRDEFKRSNIHHCV